MVLTFASAGADVVIASRKLDACEELAKEVRDTTGRVATLSTETGNRGMSLSAAPYGEIVTASRLGDWYRGTTL